MTPTREETLQAELEALRASLPDVARKAREEALEEAAKVADSYVVRGTNRDKWINGNASGIADDIRALKSMEAK